MYLFKTNLNLLANTSTTDAAQYDLGQNLTANYPYCWSTDLTDRGIPMQQYTSTEMYANKFMESQTWNYYFYMGNSVS